MKIRIRIRVFVDGKLYSDDTLEHTEEELAKVLPILADKHATLSVNYPTMIELEFLDEPDERTRFFRLGTDVRRMIDPIAIELNHEEY